MTRVERSGRGEKCQSACKPGFVWRAFAHVAAIRLGRPLPDASRNQPGRLVRKRLELFRARAAPIRSCSRWGLPCRPRCRVRGGLLPHLFTLTSAGATRYPRIPPTLRWSTGRIRRPCRGGLFSVALSLRSPPPVVDRHRFSVEPGLSSPSETPGAAARPTGAAVMGDKDGGVKGTRAITRSRRVRRRVH